MATCNLPPEVLIKIFMKVPFRELLICSETCKSWNDLIKKIIFPKRSIVLVAYNCEQFAELISILDSPLRTFTGGLICHNPGGSGTASPHPHLSEIKRLNGLTDIRFAYKIAESDIIDVLNSKSASHVSNLSLQHSNAKLSVAGLSKLKTLNCLSSLDITGLEDLNDNIFSAIVKKVPSLKVLHLNYCGVNSPMPIGLEDSVLTQNSVIAACKVLPLKELSLASSGINDRFMEDLGSIVKLDKLDISFCSLITLKGLYHFFKGHRHRLKSLDLFASRRIFLDYGVVDSPYTLDFLSTLTEINLSMLSFTQKGFSIVMENLKSVEKIELWNVDVSLLPLIITLNDLPNQMTHLNLSTKHISIGNANHLASFPRLNTLKCCIGSLEILETLCYAPNLSHSLVSLQLNCKVLESVKLGMFKRFKNLESLELEDSKLSLRKKTIFSLRKLERLNISSCTFHPSQGIENVFIHHPRLKRVTLQGLDQITNAVTNSILESLQFLSRMIIIELSNVNKDGFKAIGEAKRLKIIQASPDILQELSYVQDYKSPKTVIVEWNSNNCHL